MVTTPTGETSPLGIPIIRITYNGYPDLNEELPDGQVSLAWWETGTITTEQFADEVMRLIDKDTMDGILPTDVSTFSELHDYVDANGYILEVIGIEPDSKTTEGWSSLPLSNAVSDMVSKRLAERANAGR